MALDELMARAVGQHRAGRLEQAEALYRQVLAQTPDHPDALNLLGVLRAQRGALDQGRALIERALAAAPDQASAGCLVFFPRGGRYIRPDWLKQGYTGTSCLCPSSTSFLIGKSNVT